MAFGDIVQSKSASVNSLLSVTVTPDSPITDGNLVVCGYMTTNTTVTIGFTGSGFTVNRVDRTTLILSQIYYKVASSEPSSYTWDIGEGTLDQAAIFVEIEGPFDDADLVDIFDDTSGQGTTTILFDQVITTVADTVIVALALVNQNSNSLGTWTGGFTEVVETTPDSAIFTNAAIAIQVATATGTFDTQATAGVSCAFVSHLYAFSKGEAAAPEQLIGQSVHYDFPNHTLVIESGA